MKDQALCRTANLNDLPTLLEFEQKLIAAERPFALTLRDDPIHYYDLKHFVESETTHLLVAIADDVIIGSGYAQIRQTEAHHNSDQHAYLGFMYVEPEWRGQGINQLIMNELTAWAKSRQVRHFRLDVFIENQPAIKAYKKAGFESHMVEMVMELKS